jgi:hypothetical protein
MQIGLTIKIFSADGVRICGPKDTRKLARLSQSLAFWSAAVPRRFSNRLPKRRSSAALQKVIASAKP